MFGVIAALDTSSDVADAALLAALILMLLGAKRLPEMGHSLGRSLREFKDGVLGREPGAPSQETHELSRQTADRTKQRNPAG